VTFLVWTFRILVILLILRLVVRFVSQMKRTAVGGRQAGPPAERAGGTLVQDPQCGMYVPQSRALAVTTRNGSVYFCSTACRDRWLEVSAAKVKAKA
jgi:YHS domain-containing protein